MPAMQLLLPFQPVRPDPWSEAFGDLSLATTPKVSPRMLSSAEVIRLAQTKLLDTLPRPTLCTEEQLALAVGYLFTLSDDELQDRHDYVMRMTRFVSQSKREMKFLQLRNLKVYAELLEQAITARIQGRMRLAQGEGI